MTAEQRAQAVLEIEPYLRGRLVGDIGARSTDIGERMELVAGVLALLVRRLIRDVPHPTAWLEEIVRAALR